MKRAARSDLYIRVPFSTGIRLPYQTKLDEKQFQQIQWGLIPEVMEDKWFVYYEKPHLYFHRSWTGLPVYRLTLEERDGSSTVVEALLSTERANQKVEVDIEYEARLVDFLLYAVVLHEMKEFPLPDGVESWSKERLLHLQGHISGTAFPASHPKSKKNADYKKRIQ
jgi:hypothetical protein